jgi:hypothetical protein
MDRDLTRYKKGFQAWRVGKPAALLLKNLTLTINSRNL